MKTPLAIAVVLTLTFVGWTAVWKHRVAHRLPDARILAAGQVDHSIVYSNILPQDYLGPQACAECHQEQFDDWSSHPHACMNQLPSPDSVRGNFAEYSLELPTGRVLFRTEADPQGEPQYRMDVFRSGEKKPFRQYVVTKTVGSRYIQSYIGKQLKGPEPEDHAIYGEHRLPFTYWFKIGQWLPGDFYNIHPDETVEQGIAQTRGLGLDPHVLPYTETCMNCHNTFSYAYRIYHKPLVGFPDALVASTLAPLARELSASGNRVEPTLKGIQGANQQVDPARELVSLGISCESCHLGGREHVINQRKIRFLPTSRFVKLQPRTGRPLLESRGHGPTLLGTCSQCHTGNGELFPNGAGKSNSREAKDLHAGFCASEMSCVNCHDPHKKTGSSDQLSSGILVQDQCIQCHPKYSRESERKQHGGFDGHQELSCLDCHMPRYTRGIDDLIRTHRISHPVEETMVREGSANACNACHLDQSTRWTLEKLEQGWGRRIEPQPSWPIYTELDQPAGETWLASQDSHMRLLASQLYARPEYLGDRQTKLGDLIQALNDPQQVNRVFATFSVKRLLGWAMDKRLPVKITDSPGDRKRQIELLLEQLAN